MRQYTGIPYRASRLLSESTKSQHERDSFFTMQVAWTCDNTKCVCWNSVPCTRLFSESTKNRNERDNFLNVQYRAAGCFLKVRKPEIGVTVSVPRTLLGNATIQTCVCRYSVLCSRLLSESTKSQNERDSFLTVQVAWKCDNTKCVCWYSVPCSKLLSESKKGQNVRDSFLTFRLRGNATIQNARAGISYRAAGCFLKARKAKISVTVSLPSRLLGNATIQKCVCGYSVPCSRRLSESTKSQHERDSFLTMQVAWKCGNAKCVCWYSVPCSRLLSESTKSQFWPFLLSERSLLHGTEYQHTHFVLSHFQATCTVRKLSRSFWLLVLSESSLRKAKLSATVSLPCRLRGNAIIPNAWCW